MCCASVSASCLSASRQVAASWRFGVRVLVGLPTYWPPTVTTYSRGLRFGFGGVISHSRVSVVPEDGATAMPGSKLWIAGTQIASREIPFLGTSNRVLL